MINLVNTKSILAKLLAGENITVQHQNVPTAFFDLKNRVLTCPVLKDMDGPMYDLFMGHEVGHALETPHEGWHHVVTGNANMKTFLNVVEDARIEKKMKRRYPGLSRSFNIAYKELYTRDFFGISRINDLNNLNLIDRINLRCKIGTHIHVPFSDEEMSFVNEVENTETWDQVVDVATRIFNYVKNHESDKINSMQDMFRQELSDEVPEGDDQDQQDMFGFADKSQDSESNESDDAEGSFDSGDFDQADDYSESDETDESGQDPVDADADDESIESDGPISVTDTVFRRREQDLVNESGSVDMFFMPEPILENIIVPANKFVTNFEKMGTDYNDLVTKALSSFNKTNKNYILHLLKEFEMRKSASQYLRTQTAATGELDMNMLHKYKFSNDIFKKIQITDKGKSHGLILFLDMSSSMSSIFRNTVEQLLVLVSFCKLARIPFDVYGFSDVVNRWDGSPKFVNSDDAFKCECDGFGLIHLIGSSLSSNDYRRCFNMLAIVARFFRNCKYTLEHYGFNLGSTPFIPTLVASRKMIDLFKDKHKSDIVNVIYLTDGDGTSNIHRNDGSSFNHKASIYLIDRKTKIKVRGEYYQNQTAITQLVSLATGCKHIGFYLTSQMQGYLSSVDHNKRTDMQKFYKENGFIVTKNIGYEKYFYIRSSNGNITDGDLKINGTMTGSKIAKEMIKHQKGRSSNRVLVTTLAQELATM